MTMRTTITASLTLALLVCEGPAWGQGPVDSPSRRLLRASEAEQVAAVNLALDKGLPPEQGDVVGPLFLNKRSLTLPLVEAKIEQVLRSAAPKECFTDKAADPERFIIVAAATIATAGDEEALRQIAKLIKLDEKRFGGFVGRTLDNSKDYAEAHNPFVVAYLGLALGDPVLDQRIAAWAELRLSTDPRERAGAEAVARKLGTRLEPPPSDDYKRAWAEALLQRYAGAPTESQWATDPLASRLPPSLALPTHAEVLRFAMEAQQKRARQ